MRPVLDPAKTVGRIEHGNDAPGSLNATTTISDEAEPDPGAEASLVRLVVFDVVPIVIPTADVGDRSQQIPHHFGG
ncbi:MULTISPECIES: hypothetical protein [unclassified Mycolicibacterium]|uniref:hypothetical protein n=1 Tax=unclassified Mycolicibacterium TaxID=2636767 RepID=UPI001EE4B526|nr:MULTISPECIES: hypothetical protein [unclassified Mycolicibacterium]